MATYEEIKNVPNQPDTYLIDVRNENELAETGVIPASINIPLPNLLKALESNPPDFKAAYGREKPEKDADIIFTCRMGRRVLEAEKIATNAGFTNVRVYSGSWLDWAEKEGLPK